MGTKERYSGSLVFSHGTGDAAGGAFLLGALAQRLRQSPIIGYLLAGTIIGPVLFNAQAVSQSAELGVSLLLFSIGLEFSLHRLRQMGRMAFGGGSPQVMGTMVLASLIMVRFTGWAMAVSIGAIVALSSTAVVMRILVDRAEIDSVWGRTCLATQIRSDIGSLRTIMVTLFFASVGMLAKPMWFATHLHWILFTAALIFIAKALIVFVVARLFSLDRRHALAIGITMAQIGEFSLVLVTTGRGGVCSMILPST